jgi:Rrf2 family iron-sulfur cluster assembly transcriptional regulator
MYRLAAANKDYVPIRELARSEGLSGKYLERLFASLRRAGLVRSTRGPLGGYMLARPPKDVSIKDILDAVGETLTPVRCVDETEYCIKTFDCRVSFFWTRFNSYVGDFLSSFTLRDLLETRR